MLDPAFSSYAASVFAKLGVALNDLVSAIEFVHFVCSEVFVSYVGNAMRPPSTSRVALTL